ncbi:MAG: CvpA family protein [Chitinophagales bacterium]|nr:CvpA family protein [Chitinophagaceae bacterium]MCB9063672.1 CvpA family protein [Chitinophagales bacterium]
MIIDIIAITLIIIFFIRGYMKGIIVAAFSLIAIVLGIICALKLSERLASYLLSAGYVSSGWAQLLSYVVLFIGVVWLVRIIAKAIESAASMAMLGWANKGIGGLLYAFLAVTVCSSIFWLGREMQLLSEETIAASKTYPYIEPVAPWIADKVGMVLPFLKNVFADLQTFFTNVNEYLPEHVDTTR